MVDFEQVADVRSEAKTDPKNAKSAVVDLEFAGRLDPATPLSEIKQSGKFDDWALVRQGRLSTMQDEMQRAQTSLWTLDPAPYFLSYSVYDQSLAMAVGSQGSLVNSTRARRRAVDVRMRIGTRTLDNSHAENRASASSSGALPRPSSAGSPARTDRGSTHGAP